MGAVYLHNLYTVKFTDPSLKHVFYSRLLFCLTVQKLAAPSKLVPVYLPCLFKAFNSSTSFPWLLSPYSLGSSSLFWKSIEVQFFKAKCRYLECSCDGTTKRLRQKIRSLFLGFWKEKKWLSTFIRLHIVSCIHCKYGDNRILFD